MMPELKALFDSPRRLLPGKGARIQGYGNKRAISEVQASGANGVLTLSRSDQSGLTPSLGTNEEPAELRAGPGVRLHGYGGIHTLERVPVAVIEEKTPLGPARLEWEIELFQGNATICVLREANYLINPGNWVISETTTQTFTEGAYTDTLTASGVVSAYGPDDPPPSECAEPVFTTTQDEGTDYGDAVSSEYSEELVPFSSLASPAIAAVGLLSSSDDVAEWSSVNWRDVSTGVIPFSSGVGVVGISIDVSGSQAVSVRFRLHNRGSCAIRVNCGHYGSGLSGGASDLDQDITLSRGASSAWIEAPAINSDPLKYRIAAIRRVRIGRYRTLP